ncbi:carbohydrate kinase [Actinokineospora sp. UTMC 2448]|uniref:carbohydrate kinase family protein n=1 Tax=Actinokineospora sp. UTMC 2448 TaxID=2268449 RepID=UPI0021642BEC|nr:carbohydrate kinase [Actinokineospora sp. UTMC 2448]UVS78949.1 2-dehydro-3-deoxygluconokinase [Actinokineospora sp. UTMC 2448]
MITVVGEALADLIAGPDGRTFVAHPGGSPANVALGLARLGAPARLGTRVGDDLFGRMVRDHLAADGVEVVALPALTGQTSVAFAATDAEGVAAYDFRLDWDVTDLTALPVGTHLHTGSLATLLEPGAAVVEDAMRRARAAGATVSLDPNMRPSLAGEHDAAVSRVERQVAMADIVKVSEEDLEWLYPGADPIEVARRWADGPALVVVTLGAKGAHAVSGGAETARPGPEVTVVDTVGAGDAFMAGLLRWLSGRLGAMSALDEAALAAALDFANTVAARTCARPGADPPRPADLADVWGLLP